MPGKIIKMGRRQPGKPGAPDWREGQGIGKQGERPPVGDPLLPVRKWLPGPWPGDQLPGIRCGRGWAGHGAFQPGVAPLVQRAEVLPS